MSELKVNTISEVTGANGVVIDSTKLKDGGVIIADAGNIGSASDTDALAISSGGVVTFTQKPVINSGVAIDNITIDGTEIDLSSGDLTLDVAGDIILDADGGDVKINDGGTAIAELTNSSTDFVIKSVTNDKDIIFKGVDNSSAITALTLDMSAAGAATFNNNVTVGDNLNMTTDSSVIAFGADSEITLTHSADVGLILKHTATADDKPINLILQTGETDMAANDVIGKISWQAPDEGTGTDAILISAAIQAVAEGDHSSSSNATSLQFMTGASEAAAEKMTLTSAGILNTTKLGVITDHDLGVGIHIRTADSGGSADSAADELVIEGSAHNGITFLTGTSQTSSINFGDSGDNNIGLIEYNHNTNNMNMYTNANHRFRIDSGGAITTSTAGGSLPTNEAGIHATRGDGQNGIVGLFNSDSTSYDSTVMNFMCSRDTSNNTFSIIQGRNGGGMVFQVKDSGNVANTNNNYGSISDSRVKQDIDDASSQWNDIKALKIRKYKLKKLVNRDGADNTPYHLGVIAQELEASSMNGLVEEDKPQKEDVALNSDFGSIDGEGNFTEGQKVKSVKYSVLYMKAIKTLQEAQTRIETLETKVKALEDA